MKPMSAEEFYYSGQWPRHIIESTESARLFVEAYAAHVAEFYERRFAEMEWECPECGFRERAKPYERRIKALEQTVQEVIICATACETCLGRCEEALRGEAQ